MTKLQKWIIWSSLSALLFISATGNIRWTQLASGDRHGTATKGQASDGTGASGNCAKFAADGSVTDAGGACGVAGGAAGGDLSGTYPNPTVAKVSGGVIPLSAPCVGTNGSGQFLTASCGGTSNPVPTFTWDNQGSSTATDASGTEQLVNGTATDRLAVRYATAPATPYSITFQIASFPLATPFSIDRRFGWLFRESSTGKITTAEVAVNSGNTPYIVLDNWTNSTTFSADVFGPTTDSRYASGYGLWAASYNCYRLRDDGTNLSFWWSADCVNFSQFFSNIARTSFMLTGPNNVGWEVHSGTAGPQPVTVTMMNWIVTHP